MASLETRKSGSWVVIERFPDGTRKKHSISKDKGKQEAEAQLKAAKEREAERTLAGELTGKGWALEEFAPIYFGRYCEAYPRSAYKVEGYMKHLVEHFGDLSMDAKVSKWEERWHSYQKKRLELVSKSTVGCELACLKTILNEAKTARLDRSESPTRYSRHNPMADVTVAGKIGHTPKKQRAIFTPGELEELYAVASPRYAALWKFMANTGLRRGEVLSLQKRFISKDSVEIVHDPDQGLMTKTNRSRTVPLNKAAREALRALRTASMDSDLLVPWADQWTLSKRFKEDREAAGIEDGVLHSLRHSFISHLLNDRQVAVKTVMKIVGHSQIKTTESYLSSTDEELHAAVAGLSL